MNINQYYSLSYHEIFCVIHIQLTAVGESNTKKSSHNDTI